MDNIKRNDFATAPLNTVLNDIYKQTTVIFFNLCDENSPTVTERNNYSTKFLIKMLNMVESKIKRVNQAEFKLVQS